MFQLRPFLKFFKERFSLDQERDREEDIVSAIRRGVEFKGTNVYILIFAIFIASIGLNVNSTAVIIGAMLISPLMGPIMGVGLSIGILDFDLLKKAAKNLAVMVAVSLATSTLYFFLSPLNNAQSELLSRTTPSIWDVFIALFGGLAGIIASSSKEKGNVIPGVAIATALMPPLCTAGYGIATGNLYYTLGAFYLFTINTIFIGFSTILIVRFLKFKRAILENTTIEKKVKNYITLVVIVTIIPSIYMAYRIVQKTIYENNVKAFIEEEFVFDNTKVLSSNIVYNDSSTVLEIYLVGERIPRQMISSLNKKRSKYSIEGAILDIKQGADNVNDIDLSAIKTGILEDIYKKNEDVIRSKDEKIAFLEEQVLELQGDVIDVENIAEEARAQYPDLKNFSVNRTIVKNFENSSYDTLFLAWANSDRSFTKNEEGKFYNWLKARLKTDSLLVSITKN